jgi:hypothetical protein
LAWLLDQDVDLLLLRMTNTTTMTAESEAMKRANKARRRHDWNIDNEDNDVGAMMALFLQEDSLLDDDVVNSKNCSAAVIVAALFDSDKELFSPILKLLLPPPFDRSLAVVSPMMAKKKLLIGVYVGLYYYDGPGGFGFALSLPSFRRLVALAIDGAVEPYFTFSFASPSNT